MSYFKPRSQSICYEEVSPLRPSALRVMCQPSWPSPTTSSANDLVRSTTLICREVWDVTFSIHIDVLTSSTQPTLPYPTLWPWTISWRAPIGTMILLAALSRLRVRLLRGEKRYGLLVLAAHSDSVCECVCVSFGYTGVCDKYVLKLAISRPAILSCCLYVLRDSEGKSVLHCCD